MSTEFSNREQQEESFNNDAERTLKGIAGFVLFLGISSSIVVFFWAFLRILSHEEGGFQLFLLIAQILLPSIIVWGILRVLSNISNNLHEINSKMKK